jgi:flagellar basal body rod protein FlgB
MWNKLFGATHMMQKGLERRGSKRRDSNNIANVDTPGFKSSKVEFE